MAVTVKNIAEMMEKLAPPMLAESWDNVGLMTGEEHSVINKALIALDAVDKVIDEAIEKDCQMIITHHPLIFKGTKSVTSETPLGRRLIKLIKNNIAVYSAHTNLDIADGGTNSTLADIMGLKNISNLCPPVFENMGLGKIGELEKSIPFSELIERTKKALGLKRLVVCGDKNKTVKNVAVGTGACSDLEYMQRAKELGCDAYITGDVGYHDAQNAVDLDLCLIDAGHYATEVIVADTLKRRLEEISADKGFEIEFIKSEIYANGLEII